MLTPLDIDNQQFNRQLKGYNVDEVDDFLDEISEDYEKLIKENKELEDELKDMQKSVEQYKAFETTLQDTLIIAQKTAEDVKDVAKKEADQIIESAQDVAKKTVEKMNVTIVDKTKQLEDLKKELSVFKAKMESLLISQLELLSEVEKDVDLKIDNSTQVEEVKMNLDDESFATEEELKEDDEAMKEARARLDALDLESDL